MAYLEDVYLEDLNGEALEDFIEDFDDDDDEGYILEDFDDDDDESYDDDDDEMYDDDDDESAEFRIPSFLRRKRFGRRRRSFRRPRVAKGRRFGKGIRRRYKGSGRIKTPAGVARVKLPANLVTKTELKSSLAHVARDVRKNGAAIVKTNRNLNRLDKRYNSISASLARNAKKVDKTLDAFKQQQLFTSLIPPKVQNIEFKDKDLDITLKNAAGKTLSFTEAIAAPGDVEFSAALGGTQEVNSTKVDTTMPLLLSTMVSNAGGKGSSSNMMLPLVMMMSQNNSGSSGSGGMDSTMLMVLMMTMMK